jgi:hypothetical protein
VDVAVDAGYGVARRSKRPAWRPDPQQMSKTLRKSGSGIRRMIPSTSARVHASGIVCRKVLNHRPEYSFATKSF